jgi:hypothetical protein
VVKRPWKSKIISKTTWHFGEINSDDIFRHSGMCIDPLADKLKVYWINEQAEDYTENTKMYSMYCNFYNLICITRNWLNTFLSSSTCSNQSDCSLMMIDYLKIFLFIQEIRRNMSWIHFMHKAARLLTIKFIIHVLSPTCKGLMYGYSKTYVKRHRTAVACLTRIEWTGSNPTWKSNDEWCYIVAFSVYPMRCGMVAL